MTLKRSGAGQYVLIWLASIGIGLGLGVNAMAQAGSSHEATVRQALEWINAGQAATAYKLLEPLEGDLAGHPEYDYY